MSDPPEAPRPHDDMFGDLRALLHGAQTPATYHALWSWLDAARDADPARFAEEFAPYAAAHIARWFDAHPEVWRLNTRNHLIEVCDRFACEDSQAWQCFRGTVACGALARSLALAHGELFIDPSTLPPMPNLRVLSLWDVEVDDAFLHKLIAWPGFAQLEMLGLGNNPLTPEGVSELLDELQDHQHMRALELHDLDLAGLDLRRWAAVFDRLEALDLGGETLVESAHCAALLRDMTGARLRHLSLPSCEDDGGVMLDALASHPTMRALESLALVDSGLLPADALARLLASPSVSGLRALSFSGSVLGDEGVMAITGAPDALPSLQHVQLWGSVSEEVVRALLSWIGARPITSLSLPCVPLSGLLDGLLAALEPGAVEVLNLNSCGLSAEDVHTLARWPGLTGLRHITLSRNPVGDDAVAALLDSLSPGTALACWLSELSPALNQRVEVHTRRAYSLQREARAHG